MPASPFILLHDADNVAGATAKLPAGTHIADLNGTLTADVPLGHKFALAEIATGAPVLKHRHFVGITTRPVAPCDHVHTHNLTFAKPDESEIAAGANIVCFTTGRGSVLFEFACPDRRLRRRSRKS